MITQAIVRTSLVSTYCFILISALSHTAGASNLEEEKVFTIYVTADGGGGSGGAGFQSFGGFGFGFGNSYGAGSSNQAAFGDGGGGGGEVGSDANPLVLQVNAPKVKVDKEVRRAVIEFLRSPNDSMDNFISAYQELDGFFYSKHLDCGCSPEIPQNLIDKVEQKIEQGLSLPDPNNEMGYFDPVAGDPLTRLTQHFGEFRVDP